MHEEDEKRFLVTVIKVMNKNDISSFTSYKIRLVLKLKYMFILYGINQHARGMLVELYYLEHFISLC